MPHSNFHPELEISDDGSVIKIGGPMEKADDDTVSIVVSAFVTQAPERRANPAVACPPANANTFTGPDTNSTAFAVQGLAEWGKFPRSTSVLPSLRAVQSSDGGFAFVATKGQASDPNSTALVIQAIIAENSSPNAAIWRKGANSPYTALAS